MSLNKQNGNMYGFITYTWNPLAGECSHDCVYCSTKALMRYPVIKAKYSGKPRLVESCLKDNLGSGNFIFVCAQNDLFAKDVDRHHIWSILDKCDKFPDNTYLFQSKNPSRFKYHLDDLPRHSLLGTTIESNRSYPYVSNAPLAQYRASEMAELYKQGHKTMVTIEPILDFDLPELVELVEMCRPEWVNIGADSKGNDLQEPDKGKVDMLEMVLSERGLKVLPKGNLNRLDRRHET